jgi:cytochrome bd-type quinol oxidase subunit 2
VSEIDWNIELRKIAREYDGLPPERPRPRRSSKTEIRLERIVEIAAKYRFYDRLSAIGVWVRLVLVATLTLALFWWPYGRNCGFPLVAFLASNAVALVGGASLTVRTWRDRMGWPFAGALLVVVVAWTVIALHTLPRMGYSSAGVTTAGWSCTPKR